MGSSSMAQASPLSATSSRNDDDEDDGGEAGVRDEVELALNSLDMYDCDHALAVLSSATLGWPTGNADFDKEVLAPVHGKKEADAIDGRLKLIGIMDVNNPENADSRLAAYFVHIANRFMRIARYKSMQLEFLGHLLITMTSIYTVRSTAINQLYGDAVYDVVASALNLLQRIRVRGDKVVESAGAGEGKGKGATQRKNVPTAAPGAGASASGDVAALDESNIQVSPQVEALRKLIIAFVYAASDALKGVEDGIVADAKHGITRESMAAASIIPRVTRVLAEERVKEVVGTIEGSWRQQYAGGGLSLVMSFIVAPLVIVVALGAMGALWSPLLFPQYETFNRYLRVAPPFEWVRYLLTALVIFALFAVVYFMMANGAARALPVRQASVHAFIAGDADIRGLFAAAVGSVSVAFDVFGPEGNEEPAEGESSRNGNNTRATAAPTATADASAGAAGGEEVAGEGEGGDDAGSSYAEAENAAVAYWADTLGVSDEDAQDMIQSFDVARDAEAALAQRGDVSAPFTLPPEVASTLQALYLKLEELGEVDMANAVAERLRFIDNLTSRAAASAGTEAQAGSGQGGEGELPEDSGDEEQ